MGNTHPACHGYVLPHSAFLLFMLLSNKNRFIAAGLRMDGKLCWVNSKQNTPMVIQIVCAKW
jgi:hypothetical protein